MGLLDFLNTASASDVDGLLKQVAPGSDQKSAAIRKGLLQAGLSIMSAKTGGNLTAAIGQGGQQGMQAYDQSMDQAQKDNMLGMQLQRQGVSDTQDAAKFDAWQKANQTSTADAQAMKDLGAKYYNAQSGQFDEKGYIEELWKLNPTAAMQYTEKMKDRTAAQAPYFTPFMTSTGAGILNARTGAVDWPSAPSGQPTPAPTGSGVPPLLSPAPTRALPVNADPKLKRDMTTQDELGKQNVKEIDSSIAAINAAKGELGTLDTLGSALKKGANTGPIAQWMPTFNPATQQAKMALESFTLDNIKKLPGPASDKDVATVRSASFNEGMDEGYLKENLPNIRAAAERVIAKNQKYTDLLATGMDKAQAFKETWGSAAEGNSAFSEHKTDRQFKVIRRAGQ